MKLNKRNVLKKIAIVFLASAMMLGAVPTTAMAVASSTRNSIFEDKRVPILEITIGEPILETIPYYDIEEGTEFLVFNTIEERDAFIKNFISDLKSLEMTYYHVNFNSLLRTRSAFVGSQRLATATVTLSVNFRDNGSVVTWAEPFTTLTGFTLGFGWNQRSIGSHIPPGGRDITAFTTGEITQSFFVSGLVEILRVPVDIRGVVPVF